MDYGQMCWDAADRRKERLLEAEWRAEEAAARFVESGGALERGLADLREREPWRFSWHEPELGEERYGDDGWTQHRREGVEPPPAPEFPGWRGDAA